MRRVPDPEPAEKVWLSRLGLTLPKCKRRHDETDQDDAVPTLAWNEDILETKRGRKLFASPFHFPLLLGPFDKPGEPHILDQAFSDLRHRNTRASAH
jgi:hypothetical protein